MIKVNLLPTKAAKKKSTGMEFIYIFVALLLIEGGLLYLWQGSAADELAKANSAVTQLNRKVEALQKVKQEIAEVEQKRAQLEAQNYILDQLKDGKVGPPNMLLFLSYVLSNPKDSLANRPEIKALEQSGWNLQWDPDSVWIHEMNEDEWGVLEIKGEARGHEDAAEFYRRLKSSAYFATVEPGKQERNFDQGIEMKFIAFKMEAELNYAVPAADAAADEATPEEPATEGAAATPPATESAAATPPATEGAAATPPATEGAAATPPATEGAAATPPAAPPATPAAAEPGNTTAP